MEQIVVLAGSYVEARRFVVRAGLRQAITPAHADAAKGLRPTILLELPSYRARRDIHAIEAALAPVVTWSKTPPTHMLVDMPADPDAPAPEDHQTTIDEQIADALILDVPTTAGASTDHQAVLDAGTRADEPVPAPPAQVLPAGHEGDLEDGTATVSPPSVAVPTPAKPAVTASGFKVHSTKKKKT